MAKAIHWPAQFRDEVLAEDCSKRYCALRLGTLYYDNRYWMPDEIVDIRVAHKKVRKAVVQGDMALYALKELPPEVFAAQKQSLQNLDALRQYLTQTYAQPLSDETPLSVVYYKNLPVVPEEIE